MPAPREFTVQSTRWRRAPIGFFCLVLAQCTLRVVGMVRAPINDPDVWWVAAAGRQMAETGAIPRQNLFGFTDPSHPWLMHEWLFGPVYAWGLTHFGPPGFVALAALLYAMACALLVKGTLQSVRNPSSGLLLVYLALACFGFRFESARPTHVALLFPMAMVVIAFAPRFGVGHLAACAALELVWANSHGSFPLGILVLALAALERSDGRRLRFYATGIACAVTLMNPYGVQLHRFVADYFLAHDGIYRELARQIDEFSSVFAARHVLPMQRVGLAFAFGLALSALPGRRYRLRATFCLLLVGMAARQTRHIELCGLLTCLLLAPRFDEWLSRLELFSSGRWVPGFWARSLLVALPLCVGLLGVGYRVRFQSNHEWVPRSFLSALSAVPDDARLYIPFESAGMAIWFGFERGISVYFDSRNDCYRPETFQDFQRIANPNTPPDKAGFLLAKRGTTHVLLPSALGASRLSEPRWTRTRLLGSWQLFEANPVARLDESRQPRLLVEP